MRLEQRIGRVDRIGQQHVVRAINFVLEDTVEHRVRQVLEEKLSVIAEEFGVDKASDVMDSVEAEPIFDELFVHGLQDPATIEKECDAAINQVRDKVAEARKNSGLLADTHALEPDDARKRRDHPAQFWLERAITTGLPARGGAAVKSGEAWRVRWADGSESPRVCFDARTAEQNPELEWVTLEDPRARAVISELPAGWLGNRCRASRWVGYRTESWACGPCGRSACRRRGSAASAFCRCSPRTTGAPLCRPPSASGICCSLKPSISTARAPPRNRSPGSTHRQWRPGPKESACSPVCWRNIVLG